MLDAFKILSELSLLGKKEKEEEIDGKKILIQTLDSEKEGNVFVACADLSGSAYFNKLKSETLKYAIIGINGQRIDDYEKLDEGDAKERIKNETLEKLDKIILKWDQNIISFLYKKWVGLSGEAEKELKKKGIIEDDDDKEEKEKK